MPLGPVTDEFTDFWHLLLTQFGISIGDVSKGERVRLNLRFFFFPFCHSHLFMRPDTPARTPETRASASSRVATRVHVVLQIVVRLVAL